MIGVYAVSLVLGLVGIIAALFGGALAENLGRPEIDPASRLGEKGKAVVAAMTGFGMGGMSAEFSPLGLGWRVSLLLALVAAGLAVVWVRYSTAQAES